MSAEQWIALSGVCVAVLALAATALLGLALRRTRAEVRALSRPGPAGQAETGSPTQGASTSASLPSSPPASTDQDVPVAQDGRAADALEVLHAEPLPYASDEDGEPRVVTRDGRVVVLPSTEQVVEATMGRPMIRGAVLGHGIRYALRPESRDRLRGMIRREYRRRRRIRLRAGRRAAKAAHIPASPAQSWLGTAAGNRLNVEDDGGS